MPENITPASLRAAQDQLSDFVFRHAVQLSTRLGFSWTAAPDAPNTYKDLVAAFNQSQQTYQPLPVSDENSSRTVFGTPEANFAYRFVHDVHHVEGVLRFSSKDEFRLAVEIVGLFETTGVSRTRCHGSFSMPTLSGRRFSTPSLRATSPISCSSPWTVSGKALRAASSLSFGVSREFGQPQLLV